MKLINSKILLFVTVLFLLGFVACDEEGPDPAPTPAPVTPPPATPTPPPAPCPCDDGCCDSSGQCKSGEHCIDFPLVNQEPVDGGMKCTFEIKGIECMDCCNLNAARLKGQGTAPMTDESTLQRGDSTKDVSPRPLRNISSGGSGWESAWDTGFGCQGNPIGCGDGSYTSVLIFPGGCPEVIELCFRNP